MIKIKYIGNKPTKYARFGDLELNFSGPGDIKEVPDSCAGTVNAHPDVWEIVGHAKDPEPAEIPVETKEEPVEPVTLVDLNSMDKTQLQAYCQREFGQTVDPKWNTSRLRKYVRDVMGQRQYG